MKRIIIIVLLVATSFNVYAQEEGIVLNSANPGYDSSTEFFEVDPYYRPIGKWVLTGIIPPLTLAFGRKVWAWGESHEPRMGNEGWFGQDTSFGGADKVGHLYAHYVVERMLFTAYDHLDSRPNEALIFSTTMSCIVGLMIELGDMYTSAYGFSFNDLAADYAGVAIGTLLDKYPLADSFFALTVTYTPTEGYLDNEHGWLRAFEWVNDYSGFKYLANFKLAGLKNIGINIPEFLRYIQLDAGYYTKDYSTYDHMNNHHDKRRYLYCGISINFAEIVKDFYEDDSSVACRISQIPFRYYTIPSGPDYSKKLAQ
ncbi:MAG TPA: DUF2279 domain-containing protein [Spirochaetota bacterium]|nr:DUF2279 domain-containing protein [Spirochaetota bacterium]HQO39654.1 DUF2279 domain-containing protein [Spirochaetota bacterium]